MKNQNKKLLIVILIFFIILIFYNIPFNNNITEAFHNGNFSLCKPEDCDCLKLNRAPDGKCVKYKIALKPLVQEYENKNYRKPYVVTNNLYPKKRPSDILIFVGSKMRYKKSRFDKPPRLLDFIQEVDYSTYSKDITTNHIYDIFETVVDMMSHFTTDEKDPYLKYLILDVNNVSKDRPILGAYKIDITDYPAIYLYNEANTELKKFKFKTNDEQCDILEKLIIFVADGDCGLISYINHLHDSFMGVKFIHDSRKNKWEPNNRGFSMMEEGTNMCKLIDYTDLPDNFSCKKHKY